MPGAASINDLVWSVVSLRPTVAAVDTNAPGPPIWPWIIGGLVLLAAVLAIVAHFGGGDEVRFDKVSAAASFAAFAALVRRGGEAESQPISRLAESRRRVTVGFKQLAAPDVPLRFTLYRGPGRGGISVVISGEGPERTILVESGKTIATVRAPTGEIREVLEHLVDDIAATGDAESASALNRWLG